MALITFKDLPDTTTPLTADNLNNNFTECNNIIESGSNDNGEYIKFSDGTMICTKEVSGETTYSVWTSPIIFADISGGDFAVAFTSTPYVEITNVGSQTTVFSVYNGSASNIGSIRTIGISASAASKYYDFKIVAIGKWK